MFRPLAEKNLVVIEKKKKLQLTSCHEMRAKKSRLLFSPLKGLEILLVSHKPNGSSLLIRHWRSRVGMPSGAHSCAGSNREVHYIVLVPLPNLKFPVLLSLYV